MLNVYASNTLLTTATVTNTETVVCQLPGGIAVGAGKLVVICASATNTLGTAGVGIVAKVRRGTTTGGTLIDTFTLSGLVATNNAQVDGVTVDTPGDVANQQYCLTLTQTSATGNGTVTQAGLAVFVTQ